MAFGQVAVVVVPVVVVGASTNCAPGAAMLGEGSLGVCTSFAGPMLPLGRGVVGALVVVVVVATNFAVAAG